ncbi:MAG: Acetyl-CoA acetyltransferase [Subtercola sp.]|nr:Acetyl-CoA acetyltransferase [Subtercola sp.]
MLASEGHAVTHKDDASRIPVIIGVGQINDRPENLDQALDSLGLMRAALEIADADAGGGWLAQVDSLAVVAQISFRDLGDVSRPLADSLGISPRYLEQTAQPLGESPIQLIHEAANRIGSGEATVAAAVGGEALRTAAKRAALGNRVPNASADLSAAMAPPLRAKYGLVAPVDVYPLYENATRAAWGQTLAEGQAESGEIWSRMSEVAAETDGAWLRKSLTPEEIITPTADNRPIAFPYTKLMVANSSVNQGAAVILTSLALARAAGIPEERLIYVGHGAAAGESEDPLNRESYTRSTSMAVSIGRTMELNHLSSADLDYVELYSCFPCVPKMARRILDWPVDRPATVFGGLTFGGGPIGNYMMHAVASMVTKLRDKGTNGLLFANGGFATHNHSLVISRQPVAAGTFPQDFQLQAEADAARDAAPVLLDTYTGPATIETYTVIYDRAAAARFGIIVGRTPQGDRFLARVPRTDTETIAFLTDGAVEPIGTSGTAVTDGEYSIWTRQ